MFGKKSGADSSPGAPGKSGPHKVAAVASVVKATLVKRHKDGAEWRFITLVRPDGAEHFGAGFETRIPDSAGSPDTWHQIPVLYRPDSATPKQTVELDLTRLDAVDLTKKVAAVVQINGVVIRGGNATTLPAACPGCGAAVDLAVQSQVSDPLCTFCHHPLLVAAPNPSEPPQVPQDPSS
jgi:hypothetical protein